MSYAVYHCEKGNISSGGIGNHIDRKIGAEHTYRHADPNKKDLNQSFNLNRYCSMPLHQAIEERIKEGYKSPKAIRKDAVKYTTHILTGSHEKMKELEKNPEQFKSWVNENKKFLEQEFGKENIVRFVLHRDEKTPHLHAVTINLTSDGRLSAKEIIGNKKDMQNRQDRYAQAMQSFGLQRGIKSTGIKHENAREYYARIEQAQNSISKNDFKAQKNAFGIYKSESVEELQNVLKSQKIALKSKDLELTKLKEEKKKDADFKLKIIENRKITEEKLKYAVLSNDAREKIKQEQINEIGRKYYSDIRLKFAFISHDIQQKSDEQIKERVSNMTKKVAEEKGLSKIDTALLLRSNEVKSIERELQRERERRNDLDQKRGRGRGI